LLNQIKIKEYRENKGKICPYCGKQTVENHNGMLKIVNQDKATQKMQCSSCKKIWREIYPMFDIEEIEEKDTNNEKIIPK